MKTSEFILSAIGLMATWHTGQLIPAILFGLLAYISYRRLMRDMRDQGLEDEQPERDTEPWESLWRKITRRNKDDKRRQQAHH